jgi:hypothetical protein
MAKYQLMELREFKLVVPGKGTIEVSFILHFSDQTNSASASEIKIHSDFNSDLPHRPHLMLDNGTWKFRIQHPVMKNNEVVVEDEFLSDGLNKEIIDHILQIIDDAGVK